MMRRILLAATLLALLIVPGMALAQPVTPFDNMVDFAITDQGFTIPVPDGWVFQSNNQGKVAFASTQDELDLVTDDDDATQPSGSVITLNIISVDAIKEAFPDLGDAPTLSDLVDLVVTQSGLTELQDRVEVPILARHSITIFGQTPDTRTGVISFWQQKGLLLSLALSSPDTDTLTSLLMGWGNALSNIKPIDALELDETQTILLTDFSIKIPAGWTPQPDQPNIVYELADDVTSGDTAKGALIVAYEEELAAAELTDESTAVDYAAFNQTYYALTEPVRSEEFIILGQPAITLRGTEEGGQWTLLTQTIINGKAVTLGIVTNSEEELDKLEPTWIAMLRSIVSTTGP